MRRALFSLLALAMAVPVTVAAVVGTESSAVHALPAGFTDSQVAGISSPTGIEQLPYNRVAVLEQHTGRVRLISSVTRAVSPTPAIDLSVCSGSERGLLGFTHDPDFGTNQRVYMYYTRHAPGFPGGCVNRVSVFTMVGDTIIPGSESVLLDNISSVNGNHNGGDIEIGNDGFLYVATGDAGRDPRGNSGSAGSNNAAQDLSLLNGKILRLNRFTGGPAAGNPLSGAGTVACGSRGNVPSTPTTSCREIYSWGIRNAYRFAFDPNTPATRFFINDVGQGTYEEVNNGIKGANYGWNDREGPCPQGQTVPCPGPPAGVTDPITAYGRGLGQYITAGAFIPDGAWPAQYDGGYLFVDGGSGRMWLRRSNGTVDYNSPFANLTFSAADMAFVLEPDGYALWYTLNAGSSVRRISIDLAPTAASGPQRFEPLDTPMRAFDSRQQNPATRIRGGTTRVIDVDAPSGATAALVNLTMVGPAGGMYATAWEPRTKRPATSNVNAETGEAVANTAIVPVDANGNILLYVWSTTHAIVDVSGYFVPSPGATRAGRYNVVDPVRAIDSRLPSGAGNQYTRISRNSLQDDLNVPIAGKFGVPASAGSVALIATGLSGGRATSGHVTVYPGGAPLPSTSNVNVNGRSGGVGDVRANQVVVPIGADGSVDVRLHNVDDIVLDVVGWFSDSSAASSTAGRFVRIAPTREVDTRIPQGFSTMGPGSIRTLNPGSVPNGATGVAQNITLAGTWAGGYVTAWPSGPWPLVSNVNSTKAGQIRAALAFTKLAGGSSRFYSFSGTELVVDVFGYFQ
ncbi:MAG: PQQ-dependent sugar dehydrogenase [Acidimicrobiia bacterium]|nr:PQQ-dependent sugar dehydrogenase [Acidimicrobiia bacterium]